MSAAGIRVQRYQLPNVATPCPKSMCAYNTEGICDDPRINKGNGDAACHRTPNKDVLKMLAGSAGTEKR